MKLEIERKFLLKGLPEIKPSEIIRIEQYYFKNPDGVWERARSSKSGKKSKTYLHTVKKTISKGVNIEDERPLTKSEFNAFKDKCLLPNSESLYISKNRWIYPDGDLYWEVDVFNSGYTLVVAEIELPKEDHSITIPEFIKNKLLLEVTGLKQFSSRNLSNPIKKINVYYLKR